MKIQGIGLIWITVADIKAAIKFYTEVMGFKLSEFHEAFGWAELSGPTGALLGLAQFNSELDHKPGSNAIPTITVEDINLACEALRANKVQLIGTIQEIPGEVKLQTFTDHDGNTFQLCQLLKK